MRDLFLALRDTNNRRKHPLLVVLLYAYCPRAVRWWVTGAEPVLPPDPVWLALEDMAAGYTLREAFIEHGLDAAMLETAMKEAYRYVSTADSFRDNYYGIDGAEATPIFETMYDQQRISLDFQLRSRMEKIFGSWDGFYDYVRTYAFLFEDWARSMGFEVETAAVEAVTLSLRFAGISRLPSVHWPTWVWHDDEDSPREVVSALALPETGGQPDPLRFSLLNKADRVDNAWSGIPDTFALDPSTGVATPFVPPVGDRDLAGSMIAYYHQAIKTGPYPPLAALTAPGRCASCGFRHVCYKNDGSLQQEIFLER